MTSFATTVLVLLIILSVLYLIIALHSFGVKLPKRLRLTIGIIFIVFIVDGIIGLTLMNYFPISTIVFYALTLLLGIYMLISTRLPKRLKIVAGIIAILLALSTVAACFVVPDLYNNITMSSFIDTYSTLQ